MIIFLAVMMTDIILLDLFNTFGLPTSTTVSIVFELLGSAVAVSVVKISRAAESITELSNYINSDRALAIISGIFLSVIVAFTVGAIIQWLIRIFFSFNVKKTLKYWGGIWGGIALSGIMYFLLIKGAKSASFMSDETAKLIHDNQLRIILYSFLSGTILFQLLLLFTRINILKIIVLLGTFALAMAFAGNDLVNFIGVPLAGFESFKAFSSSGAEPGGMLMEILTEPVRTPTLFLLIAGAVMALTLRYSKKARSVTATTIDLSRQGEGSERFDSSAMARFFVRRSLEISNFFRSVAPKKLLVAIDNRFNKNINSEEEILAFDLVRASVNLVVASILISIGTSLKLPLSTTYVTFMVTMGTSLSDRAWGRESAVYRITGMLTVVGGWFLTALSAFTAAFIIGLLITFGGMAVIFVLIAVAAFIVTRTHFIHKKRQKSSDSEQYFKKEELSTENVIKGCADTVTSIIVQTSKLYYLALLNFNKEKRKQLNSVRKQASELNKETKKLKSNLHSTINRLNEDEIDSGHHYVQILDYLRETTNCMNFIVNPLYNHVNNNHSPLTPGQADELMNFNEKMSEFFNFVLTILRKEKYDRLKELKKMRDDLINRSYSLRKSQIKLLKKSGKGTKVSMVFLDIMTESKNLLLFITNVIEAHKNFVDHGIDERRKF